MNDQGTTTRTERLLALIVLHNMGEASQVEKTVTLSRAEFTNGEIAELLGTSTAVISQNLYSAKKVATKNAPRATKRSAKASS